MTVSDRGAAARTVSDLAFQRVLLTGAAQRWLADCAEAARRGPEATRALLRPGDEVTRALAQSPRRWLTPGTGPASDLAGDGPRSDELEVIAAAATGESPDLAAARAIASVACALTGSLSRADALATAVAHWRRANLPGFDAPAAGFPAAMYAGVDDQVRAWLAEVATADDIPCRGFLGLLAVELAGGGPASRHEVATSVLFDRRFDGGSAMLRIALRPSGPAGIYPDPARMAFLIADPEFQEAVGRAWAASPLAASGQCVVWSVLDGDEPCVDLAHGSLGAAFAVALRELHRRVSLRRRLAPRTLDPRSAVTAGLGPDAERLEAVAGYAAKLDAARRAHLRRVVVPSASLLDFRGFSAPTDPFDLVGAATVGDAMRLARTRLSRLFLMTATSVMLVIAIAVLVPVLVIAHRGTDQAKRAALASSLSSRADSLRASSPGLALRLGAEAVAVDRDAQTSASLLQTLSTTRYAGALPTPEGTVMALAVSRDGRFLAAGINAGPDKPGRVVLWSLAPGHKPVRRAVLVTGTRPVTSVSVSPDDRVLAASDGQIKVWNIAVPGQPVQIGAPFPAYSAIMPLQFSPRRDILAAGGDARAPVVLWDLTNPARPTDTPLPGLAAVGSIWSLAFSADGSTVVGGGNLRMAAWDISHPAAAPSVYPVCTKPGGPVDSVASAGATVATGCESGYIYRWRIVAPGRLRGLGAPLVSAVGTSFPNSVYGLAFYDRAFDGGGGMLAAARDDGTVVRWDTRDPGGPRMDEAPLSRHQGAATSVVALPGTTLLASGGADGVLLWDVASTAQPRLEKELVEPREAPLETAMFAPDGQHLLTGSVWQTVPSYLSLWPIAGHGMARGPATAGGPVNAAAFATDGSQLATVDSRDGTVSVWGTAGGALSFRRKLDYPGPHRPVAASAIAFAKRGRLLVDITNERSIDSVINVWNMTTAGPMPMKTLHVNIPGGIPARIRFTADGATMAVVDTDGVELWDFRDPTSPRKLATITPREGVGGDVAFTRDGKFLVTAGGGDTSGSLIRWDVSTPAHPVQSGEAITADAIAGELVAVSPDGTLVASAGNDGDTFGVRLWDLSDSAHPRPAGDLLATHGFPPGGRLTGGNIANAADFSPDGTRLAVTDGQSHIMIWNLTGLTAARRDPLRMACTRGAGGGAPTGWASDAPGATYHDPCAR